MNISGILVIVPSHRLAAITASLNALSGVSVHHAEPSSGRIIVTLEAETTAAEIAGLERIKALPDVILAELVYHYFENETADGTIQTAEGE